MHVGSLKLSFAKTIFPFLVGLLIVSFGFHQWTGLSLISTNALPNCLTDSSLRESVYGFRLPQPKHVLARRTRRRIDEGSIFHLQSAVSCS